MPSEHLILLTDIRPGLVRNCPLVSPSRPHDRWCLIDGVPYVCRPGTASYDRVAAPSLPSDLSIDCADDEAGRILDSIIDAEIPSDDDPRWPEMDEILRGFNLPQDLPRARVLVARFLLGAK